MVGPLKIVSDYSILNSLITIDKLVVFLKEHNITSCGLVDDNLNGSIEFIKKCEKNNIKPIIGLDVVLNKLHIFLYAKNYDGFESLLKINTKNQLHTLNINDLNDNNLKIVLPIEAISLFDNFSNAYIGYRSKGELGIAKKYTNRVCYIDEIKALYKEDEKYIDLLRLIKDGLTISDLSKNSNYMSLERVSLSSYDLAMIEEFQRDIDLKIIKSKLHIPKYIQDVDSYTYLSDLAKRGLKRRYNDNPTTVAEKRLNHELAVIKEMGFVDYFLIVYDYVLYAKKNNILVGPGRGSAAGSLVSYVLGITDVDPLKYDLLFERFLNIERVTLPDIDIDFEYTKRDLVVNYVREKYGENKVAPIITYNTYLSKQVIRDTARIFKIDQDLVDLFVKEFDRNNSIDENLKKDSVQKILANYEVLKKVILVAKKLEGLKRHTSIHAAGIVISDVPIDSVIPIYVNDNKLLTGYTMEYLEEFGLIKMDFLALKNLTIISNIKSLIFERYHKSINLNKINLEDAKVLDSFQKGDTKGIFQFESEGMKNTLRKIKPSSFNDLVSAVALFRPGPMDNIDLFVSRKNNKESINYFHPSLEDILKSTYGIIVFQEQIMQILVKMANYSYQEADLVRRAISKKKEDIILKEKDKFITHSINNGYSKDIADLIYSLIVKFANYGFNKAHSVAYALIGYQMAYLKTYFPKEFIVTFLNMDSDNDGGIKEYLLFAKRNNIEICKVDINKSTEKFYLENDKIILPFNFIKNLSQNIILKILEERRNGSFKDLCDFLLRMDKYNLKKDIIVTLIKSGAFDSFKETKNTLISNLDLAINYAKLASGIDSGAIMKPEFSRYLEYNDDKLREFEYDTLKTYITNHPSSKYPDCPKIADIASYFDRTIKIMVLVNGIKVIKTKKNEDMAFVSISDETGDIEATLFSNSIKMLEKIAKNDFVKIVGRVKKRFDKYNINIIEIAKI